MEFDLFLWPMLVPMIIPLIYCFRYKKESLAEIGTIATSMILIVVIYSPLLASNFLSNQTYIAVKFLLFIILPLMCLFILKRNKSFLKLEQFGIKLEGIKKSLWLCLLFLPIMLVVTIVIQYVNGITVDADALTGIVSFFESFTEEFFFRGILFIFLLNRTNLKIAYVTSLASFVLVHPQHFITIFLVATIVQGILTIEICRRSNNLTGAWLLHGINRFFIIAIVPLLLS